jgi:hypothetical protein
MSFINIKFVAIVFASRIYVEICIYLYSCILSSRTNYGNFITIVIRPLYKSGSINRYNIMSGNRYLHEFKVWIYNIYRRYRISHVPQELLRN